MLLRRLRGWPSRRAVAAALTVTLGISSCATYAPRPGPPAEVLAHARTTAVLVTLRDGRTVEVLEPVLRVDGASAAAAGGTAADSVLAGFTFNSRLGRREPVALPVHDVVAVSTRVADHRANGALLTGVGVLLFTVTAIALFLIASCSGPNYCD